MAVPLRSGVVESAVDLRSHDHAVGRRVVIPAQERRGEHVAGLLKFGNFLLEGGESSAGDGLPIGHSGGWAELDAGLREARRVLKSGGRLVAIERRRRTEDTRGLASHFWTDEQATVFADQCVAHGFVDPRVERHDGRRRSTVSVTATAP